MSRKLYKLALIPVALLVCAPVAAQAQPASPDTPAAARAEVAKPLLQQDRDYYFTNVAPAVEDPAAEDQHVGGQAATQKAKAVQTTAKTTGFPPRSLVSTDEDPNDHLAGLFGGLENGLTGSTNGYRHDYVDLTPYAGSTIQLRCAT